MSKKGRNEVISKEGFPERLRQLRTSKKLSQEELGNQVQLHYTHIGRYERSLSKPSAEKLQAIAEALEVSSDYLLNGDTEDFAKARFEDQDLLNMFQEVENFNDEDKKTIKDLLEAFILKQKIRKMA